MAVKRTGIFLYQCMALTVVSSLLAGAEECENNVEELRASFFTKTISSPGYPDPFRQRCNSSWRIQADSREVIRLTVVEVQSWDAETNGKPYCSSLRVSIYDGMAASGTRVITRICLADGNPSGKVFTSSGPHMFLTFWSFGSGPAAFKLHYKAIPNPALATNERPSTNTDTSNDGGWALPVGVSSLVVITAICSLCCGLCGCKADDNEEQNEQQQCGEHRQPPASIAIPNFDMAEMADTAQNAQQVSVGPPPLTVHQNITATFIVNTPFGTSCVRSNPLFTDGHDNPGFASLEDEVSSAVNQTSPDQTMNASVCNQSVDEPPSYSSLQDNTDAGASQVRGLESRTDELHEEPPPSYSTSIGPPPTYDEVVRPTRRPPHTS